MATRRRKIARSAVRRVKRRESKNAKLRSLRSRKHSSKRINLREMKGGGVFGKDKDPNDFFSIYTVTTPHKFFFTDKFNRQLTDEFIAMICILFYNHSNGHFRLFAIGRGKTKFEREVFTLINGLCGNGTLKSHEIVHFHDSDNWHDYFIFDGKLSGVYIVRKDNDVSYKKIDIDRLYVPNAQKTSSPPSEPSHLNNVDKQILTFGDKSFTFVKAVEDAEAKKTYQGSTMGTFTSESTELESHKKNADKILELTEKTKG